VKRSFSRHWKAVFPFRNQSLKYPFLVVFSLLFFFSCGIEEIGEKGYRAPLKTFPERSWEWKDCSNVNMDRAKLDSLKAYLEGRGCVVRYGYMVYKWGDIARRGDIASSAKVIAAHFLFKAIEEGKISGLDEKVLTWEPRLKDINKELGYKDRDITWRHLVTQTACYGHRQKPGKAFAYSDYQFALFWDTLFLRVYNLTYEDADEKLFYPELFDLLGCEDEPNSMNYGVLDRPGRVSMSCRDLARLGLLYLRRGEWNGKSLMDSRYVEMITGSPLPADFPKAGNEAAEMIPGQRTYGSKAIPDNQFDHKGSYSFLWWVNGVDENGHRFWPDAPEDVVASLGHNGINGFAFIPSLDLVISWNKGRIDNKPKYPHPLNEVFRLLKEACLDY